MNTSSVHQCGFTIIEILVVLVILLLLGAMLLPTTCVLREGARKANCGNNQRQIVLAMNVYPADQSWDWPVFTANSAGQWVPVNDPSLDATATAIASLEMVVTLTGNDIPAKVFACPSKPVVRPTSEAANKGARTSVSAWVVQGPSRIGYSYDWSVPDNASSVRVVTADRDRQAHGGKLVMAAFADGHVGNLNRVGTSFINKDAKDDDIYTDTGDGPMATPGEGSTTRAFVR